MRHVRVRRLVAGVGVMVAVVGFGCARARVQRVQNDPSQVLPRPPRVLVFDFATGAADVQVDTSVGRRAARALRLSADQSDLLGEVMADTLAMRLVADIEALGLRAERARGAAPPALNDLVIEGQFVRIDEGSTTRRFVIGFGVGGTELRTQVQIFQVTAGGWRSIKQLETTATSSRMPGAGVFVAAVPAVAGTAVATSAIVSSSVGMVREFRTSLEADAGRTSEQIAKQVSQLSTAQRW